jgi:hypothetical protein
MRTLITAGVALLVLAACGGTDQPAAALPAGAGNEPAAPQSGPEAGPASPATPAASVAAAGPAGSATTAGIDGRTAELVNPDNNAMVFLYFDLAGIAPPIDRWIEDDSRVRFAPPIDKAARRDAVRSELEAGMAAVRGAGVVRLSLASANLSDYDPTYGEFTVRALAPSSVIEFDALGQKVSLRFGNGRNAQLWRVPAAEAQAIRDKVAMGYNVELDTLLVIKSVQPGPAGGTIVADVVEYELREIRGGTTLGRVTVPRS